jgi:hypothetical protein
VSFLTELASRFCAACHVAKGLTNPLGEIFSLLALALMAKEDLSHVHFEDWSSNTDGVNSCSSIELQSSKWTWDRSSFAIKARANKEN